MTLTLLRAPRRAATAALAGLVLLPVAGCGGDEATPTAGGGDSKLASLAPAAAPFYFEGAVQPDGKLKDDLNTVIKKFAPDQDLDKLTTKAFSSQDDVNFEQDIKPWLGKRVAAVVTGVRAGGEEPDFGLLVETTDGDKALAAVKKTADDPAAITEKDYKGTKYSFDPKDSSAAAIVEDSLVLATEPALKAIVDASAGDGLDSNADFTKITDKVDDDALGFFYGDVARAFELAKSSGAVTGADAQSFEGFQEYVNRQGLTTVAGGLSVTSDAVKFNVASTGKDSGQGDAAAQALSALPAGSFAGFGLGDIGKSISDGLDSLKSLNAPGFNVQEGLDQLEQQAGIDVQKDLLSWMGNTGLFVRGASITDIGGALVVQSKDPAATKAALSKARTIVAGAGLTSKVLSGNGVDDGFSIAVPGAPFEAFAVLAGEKFILAVSKEALDEAISPTAKLSDDDGFKAATEMLGGGYKPSFFVDFPKISGLVALAAGGSQDYAKAKPYLDKIGTIVAGSKRDGDLSVGTFAIGVK